MKGWLVSKKGAYWAVGWQVKVGWFAGYTGLRKSDVLK